MGTVRVGYPVEPPTLNPVAVAGASSATRDILRPVLPALFRLDDRLRPQPELVARWPSPRDVGGDPFSVTLALRTATWSDGTAITSEDVRFSWERLRGGPTGNRYRFLKDVAVLSSRRFRLVFARPVRRWWSLFSIDDMVLPAHAFGDGSAWDRGPKVSGGPFVVESWTPGLEIRLRRNDAYWGSRAAVEAIDVLFVPDDEMRLQLLARGDIDLLYAEGEVNIGPRAKARGSPPVSGALDARRGASMAWASAWWEIDLSNRTPGPLAEAFGRALDRRLVTELFEGTAQEADGVPARFPAAAPKVDGEPPLPGPWSPASDAAAARDVLQRAGFRKQGRQLLDTGRKPVEVTLAFSDEGSAADSLARLVHFHLRDLGIQVDVVPVDSARLESDWLPNGKADAYLLLRRAADAPEADDYRSDAPAFSNPSRRGDADAPIDDAESAGASARSGVTGLGDKAWTGAEGVLVRGHLVHPLVRVQSWLVSGGGVVGPEATGTSAGPFWNAGAWTLSQVT